MRTWFALLAIPLLCAACAPAAGEPPDPLELVTEAGQHIQEAESFAVTIVRSGAPVFIDAAGLIEFVRASGHYVAPDRVQARVRVLISGIAGDIDVIAIGDDQFYRHAVLTGGRWINAEFSPGFNAEQLVRSESGLARAMAAIKDLRLQGAENLDGVDVWHLTGTAAGSEVAALTIGLIPARADVQVDLYIRVPDHHPERMVIVQPDTVNATQPEPSTWTIEVFDYNGGHRIERPE
ncbi:MAG: LppX_LprAFG lipoprotein [Anaerolineae bacterium]|nr:LppX_LprAFG lipoprotein [Anaerolineae bacterium]